MNPTTVRIKQIDEEIRLTLDALRAAQARRQIRVAARLNAKLMGLRRERKRLLASVRYTPERRPVASAVVKKERFQLWDLLPKFSLSRSADKPPVGVVDRYAGVSPTKENAPTLAAYYYARAKRRIQSKQARAYFLLRLEAVKPYLPSKSGPGKLIAAAQARRQAARRAVGRKAYALSTRLTEQAASLEQQARSMAIQEASAEKMPSAEEEAPADESLPAETTTEDSATTPEDEKPWYMSPLVWAGGVVGLIVIAKAGGKGKGASKGSTSSVRKSYVVKSSAARTSAPRRTSTSLTRSL